VGRPRSSVARQAVLAAAADLVVDVGVERLSIEQVATRSGVAKTTIYRHWPSKAVLVVEAIAAVLRPVATPDSGDAWADLVACFEGIGTGPDDERSAALVLALLEAAWRDPELARLADRVFEQRRRPARTVLELARLRGELDPGTDLDTLVELITGAVVMRRLVLRRPVERRDLERVLGVVVPALRPDALDDERTAAGVRA